MTTLAELQDTVYTITNRPDLVAETILAIQTATLKEHAAIDYTKDLVSVDITLTQTLPETFRYAIDMGTAGSPGDPINFAPRKYKVVRESAGASPLQSLQTISGQQGLIDFREVSVTDIFNGYQQERPNYYYLQGERFINVVAARKMELLQLIYYALVKVAPSTYFSWIANQFPYVIQLAAAASIFGSIGRDSESRRLRAEALDGRVDIIRSNVTDIG